MGIPISLSSGQEIQNHFICRWCDCLYQNPKQSRDKILKYLDIVRLLEMKSVYKKNWLYACDQFVKFHQSITLRIFFSDVYYTSVQSPQKTACISILLQLENEIWKMILFIIISSNIKISSNKWKKCQTSTKKITKMTQVNRGIYCFN